ncbi:ATP-binding protein [Methanogenium marinum]|uniref:histidine kinase n=1 Tax=Methanogenium marinum TaxID=348610 RepID=A0A9Q4KU78_9EURY|nr:ATP-binding protein [Methanogenium marinum]MDE4908137.1 ATP-binding protein [Methanogenium marinum]
MSENQETDRLFLEKFAVALANGDLSGELKMKGTIAGSLKSLQSSLRHLSWQAKQVAKGDFSQRVDFMGEFSESFNYMAKSLEKAAIEREEREKKLNEMNFQLSREVVKRREAEESLLNASTKYRVITSVTRHDIKNQLTALQAYLDFLSDDIDEPQGTQYINEANHISDRIGHLVEFTKQFETLGIHTPLWLDIGEVIERVNENFFVGSISFRNEISNIEIYTDPLIEKVIYNLVQNSYTHGGHVSEITYSCKTENDTLTLIYIDNGVGIPASEKNKVFTKGFGKNTGLGMFFCRDILSLSEISIEETGTPGEGARFEMTIPAEKFRKNIPDILMDHMHKQ